MVNLIAIGMLSFIAFPNEEIAFSRPPGDFYGGAFIKGKSEKASTAVSALESQATEKNRTLTRAEVLATLSGLECSPSDISLVDFAVRLGQAPQLSAKSWMALNASQLNLHGPLHGETAIQTDLNGVDLVGSTLGFPKSSMFGWSVDLSGVSIIQHTSGGSWPWSPAKSVIQASTVRFMELPGESGPPVVYELTDSEESYLFPEWHPLVSGRQSLAADPRLAVGQSALATITGSSSLRSGQSVFDGYMFERLELVNGKECYVYGTLKRALFIDSDDPRKIVGEINGTAWLIGPSKIRALGDVPVTVRLNDDYEESRSGVLPLLTNYRFFSPEGDLTGSAQMVSKLLGDASVGIGFDAQEPYLSVNSDGSQPVGTNSPPSSPVSHWSVIFYVQLAVVALIFFGIWRRTRHV